MTVSFGTLPTQGIQPMAPAVFDTPGFMARSVRDIQLVCREFNIVRSLGASISIHGLRVGFVKTDLFEATAKPDLQRLWAFARDVLRDAGAIICEAKLDKQTDSLGGKTGHLASLAEAEMGVTALREYRGGYDTLSEMMRGVIEQRAILDLDEMTVLEDRLASLRPVTDERARQHVALITPSAEGESGLLSGPSADYHYLAMWTGLHVPTINMPGFFSKSGMPIGLSLVGPR